MTRIYFDCEFTGLHQHTTLISIGLVDDNDRSFYAEFTDYNRDQVDAWIQMNVIDKLMLTETNDDSLKTDGLATIAKGNKGYIASAIMAWCSEYEYMDFVSDVCHYDFVLLIDLLFEHALNIPAKVAPACHDINQDLALYTNSSLLEAFDNINREEYLKSAFGVEMDVSNKHNALHDARVIRELYLGMHDIEETFPNEY